MRDNRPLRIWLIDDKPDDRRLARRAIERYFTHAEVQEIGTLDDWQRALTSPLPNLVITDHRLHWGDGLQVLQTIKSRDPLCPVIMFTNTATEQIILDAFRQGLDDYLLKAPQHFPLIPITLVNTLKRARQQRAIHQAEARLRLLHEINRHILRAQTPQEVASAALPLLHPFLQSLFLVVVRLGRQPDNGHVLAAYGAPENELNACFQQNHFPHLLETIRPRTHPFPPPFMPADLPCIQRLVERGTGAVTVIPLQVEEHLLGLMAIGWRSRSEARGTLIEVAAQVANQLAIALHTTHLLEEERRARHIAEALQRINLTLSRLLDPQEVLEVFLDEVAFLIPYTSANVWLLEEGQWRMKAFRGYERYNLAPDWAAKMKVGLEEWPTFRTIRRTLNPLLVADTQRDPLWVPVPEIEAVRSWLGVPLVVGDQLLGIFSLDHTEPYAFSDEQVTLVQSLAASAALALHNASLYQREAQRRHALEAARQAALEVTQALDVDKVLQNLLLQVTNLTHTEDAHVFLYDAEQDTLRLGAAYYNGAIQHHALYPPRPNGITMTAARTGHEILIPEAKNTPFYTPAWGDWNGSIVCIPLKTRDGVVGVMNVAWDEPHGYTSTTLQMLRLLADHAAIAIQHARLVDDLRQRLREMEVVGTLASALRQAADSTQVAQILVQQTCQLVEAPFGVLLLIQREDESPGPRYRLILDTQHGLSPNIVGRFHKVDAEDPLIQLTLQNEAFYLQPEALPKSLHALLVEQTPRLRQVAGAPLLPSVGESIGLLLVGRPSAEPAFSDETLHLLQIAAEIGANALQRTHAYEELHASFLQTVLALAQAIDAKDSYTGNHSQRLAELALAVAEEMGLSEEQKEHLHWAALLHDIGKIGIPDKVLRKPGPLSPEEWALMKQHPAIGAEILRKVQGLRPVARIIAAHHERWDGSGYPQGLRGEDIPLEARILAVVDSYSAMIDERIYHPAIPHEEALEEIRRNAGKLYDPRVVETFFKVLEVNPPPISIPPNPPSRSK